jgi:hypothetical protein
VHIHARAYLHGAYVQFDSNVKQLYEACSSLLEYELLSHCFIKPEGTDSCLMQKKNQSTFITMAAKRSSLLLMKEACTSATLCPETPFYLILNRVRPTGRQRLCHTHMIYHVVCRQAGTERGSSMAQDLFCTMPHNDCSATPVVCRQQEGVLMWRCCALSTRASCRFTQKLYLRYGTNEATNPCFLDVMQLRLCEHVDIFAPAYKLHCPWIFSL